MHCIIISGVLYDIKEVCSVPQQSLRHTASLMQYLPDMEVVIDCTAKVQ